MYSFSFLSFLLPLRATATSSLDSAALQVQQSIFTTLNAHLNSQSSLHFITSEVFVNVTGETDKTFNHSITERWDLLPLTNITD
jgi:hypothetical protein